MADYFKDSNLIFAIREKDDDDDDSKYITCKVPHAMINKWIKCTPALNEEMERYIDRLVKAVTLENVQDMDDEALDVFSVKHGLNKELQGIMMKSAMDLKETLGDEDFFDLYATGEDLSDYYEGKRWTSLNKDGEVEVVHERDIPKLD